MMLGARVKESVLISMDGWLTEQGLRHLGRKAWWDLNDVFGERFVMVMSKVRLAVFVCMGEEEE